MQVIVHKLDWYTRIVLTLIAATLVLIVLKPVFSPRQATATAQRQIIDVNLNIDKVGGEKILTWW
ncbi:hypothetical protein J7L81_05220, partial [Candidatus Aerophobetes bacterium]|nr:hypothetical protein [Candidatus Aerophobetes bacterium]